MGTPPSITISIITFFAQMDPKSDSEFDFDEADSDDGPTFLSFENVLS